MADILEKNVDSLFKDFKSLRSYKEKLKFFDNHFDLLFFNFPSFDAQLSFLFDADKLNLLFDIFEKERKKNVSLIKKISYNDSEYVFNVYPNNLSGQHLNEYIITKFVYKDANYNELVLRIDSIARSDKKIVENSIREAEDILEAIKQIIKTNKDSTFRSQFFSVFYSGFIDCNNKQIKKYPTKKKIIELYLYSMGILFAKYREALSEHINLKITTVEKALCNSIELSHLKAKVLLLNELGVTQFLRDKFKASGKIDIENKIAEVFCVVMGENTDNVKNIVEYIDRS